ncbi:MAG: decaprenyl-phosphate phosphoribosyltransferase [Clostridiaceae bacterium]
MDILEKLKYIIKLCRPKQYIKNGFIFAAITFSGQLFKYHEFLITISTFILFSLISSCVYILNDIVDVEEDRNHPKKKFRPIASNKVKVSEAKILFTILLSITIISSFLINIKLCGILLTYFFVNIFYAYKLKKIIIIDVMTISLGFILRVLAGGVVLNISVSPWLVICTGLVTLYLGFGKRKNELIVLEDNAINHREILSRYTLEYINKILLMLLSLTNMTYILYTINGTVYKGMIYTIPFVIYGTLRYEYLITNKDLGGSPEDVFEEDKPFLINIIFWVVTSTIVIYFIR